MLSISCGGHPCKVEIVAELQTLDGIASISSLVKLWNLSALSRSHFLHSWKTAVSLASIIPSIKVFTLSPLIPSRS